MKILHTSDWHIGHQLFGFDRIDEHRYFLRQLADIVENERPDVMVVSGDIFHVSTPATVAQRLFVDEMCNIHRRHEAMRIFVTAGNHDSAHRIEVDGELWGDKNVTIVGAIPRDEEGKYAPEKFVRKIEGVGIVAAVPYFNASTMDYGECFGRIDAEVERINTEGLPVVYMAHTTVSNAEQWAGENSLSAIGGLDTVDVATLGHGYDYLALGHIHKPQTIKASDGKARYCGTPIAISFDETHEHGVDIVTIRHGEAPEIRTIEIEPLRGVRTLPEEPTSIDEAMEALRNLPDDCMDYVRLNVLIDGYMPADAQTQASDITSGKSCRFCYIELTRKESEAAQQKRRSLTISEFRNLSPIDVAREAYKVRNGGEEMPDEMAKLLSGVIAEVENDSRNI